MTTAVCAQYLIYSILGYISLLDVLCSIVVSLVSLVHLISNVISTNEVLSLLLHSRAFIIFAESDRVGIPVQGAS